MSQITKQPRNTAHELEKLASSTAGVYVSLVRLHSGDFKALLLKAKGTTDEGHAKIKEYISDLGATQKHLSSLYQNVKDGINQGMLTFKEKTPSKFSGIKSKVRKGLGLKGKPPTDVVPGHQISGQDTPSQWGSTQEALKQGKVITEPAFVV
ncbi:hypothetical protein BASA60_001946 [Batrachochytrium salamandrivorans]|nr:hypothetical protein BASA60_001946 [Batrachochytrium salamandrivorans]